MRTRIRFRIQLIFDADPVPDFYLMWMWIQVTKMMGILIHNTAYYYLVFSKIASIFLTSTLTSTIQALVTSVQSYIIR